MNEPTSPSFAMAAKDGGWYVQVRVQPGAKKTECVGLVEDRLRIRLAAPAVENKANKELLAFVAKTLGLKASKIRLVSGEHGRQKRLHIAAEQEPDWTCLLSFQSLVG